MNPFQKFKKEHGIKNAEICLLLNLSKSQISRKVKRDDWRLREMRVIKEYVNKRESGNFNIIDIFNKESEGI